MMKTSVKGMFVLTLAVLAQPTTAQTPIASVQTALAHLGYRVEATGKLDSNTQLALRAACGPAATTLSPATITCLVTTIEQRAAAARPALARDEAIIAALKTGSAMPAPPPPLPVYTTPTVTPAAVTTERGDGIRAKCAEEWPTDFAMRAYCEQQQKTALDALGRRAMISGDQRTIRTTCAKSWPDDFAMRDHCEQQQLAALKQLGR
jgi:hypothetical protein